VCRRAGAVRWRTCGLHAVRQPGMLYDLTRYVTIGVGVAKARVEKEPVVIAVEGALRRNALWTLALRVIGRSTSTADERQ
jgi:hypothetical protein